MNKTNRRAWTRDELILAINLYCTLPFGKIHIRNPEIIELAELLNRTPGSISYKLANFASIDPSLDRKGASNVSKLDKEVWEEFFSDWNEMAFDSEKKAIEIRGKNINIPDDLIIPEGKTRESIVKARINQNFFRKMVLSSYNSKCCITGLPLKELLIASHIIPWSQDSENRLNPQNGLCLNALHDKAFDLGFITIDQQYQVVVSNKISILSDKNINIITDYNGKKINLPDRFIPNQKFLDYHRVNIFKE